jgi:cobalt-zinc-cadmium efflux system membrane fusion protein
MSNYLFIAAAAVGLRRGRSSLLAAACLWLLCCAACQQPHNAADPPAGASAAEHAGHTPAEEHGDEDHHEGESAAEHAAHDHAEHGDEGHHEGESAEEHAGHAGHGDEDHDEGESVEEHAGHDHEEHGHEGHAGHHHAELIKLSPEQLKAYGVKVDTAAAGRIEQYLTLPGEVAVNADSAGHVLPKLPGVVRQVKRNLGDTVKAGDLLAVIDSRELAQAKADYLAALERQSIAEATAERERQLFRKGVSPQEDSIAADNAVREAQIQVRAAEQGLHALGLSQAQLARLAASPHDGLTTYNITAPLGGRILEKHISLGEMVSTDDELFLIASLASVWVNLSIGQQDMPRVHEGQTVRIRFGHSPSEGAAADPLPRDGTPAVPDATGRISYIDALVAEDTRTATVRVVLNNPKGIWRPGMFVSGLVTTGKLAAAVVVPLEAVINFEGQPTVFIQEEDGFEPRTVELGRQSATQAEVLSGIQAGETFVSAGAYMVKAELGKSEASHEH